MSLQSEFVCSFQRSIIKNAKVLTAIASVSGIFDPYYDKFSYALNTTQCPDGTLCPLADNQNCCHANRGIKEIRYKYNSSAVMPKDVAELSTFYAAAGYTFPTAIPLPSPTTSASVNRLQAAATSAPSSSSPPYHSDLNHGDKIGLGIDITLGILVCVVCAILLHLFIWRLRRCHRQSDRPMEVGPPGSTSVHVNSTVLEGTPAGSELSGLQQHVYELYDDHARSIKS